MLGHLCQMIRVDMSSWISSFEVPCVYHSFNFSNCYDNELELEKSFAPVEKNKFSCSFFSRPFSLLSFRSI